MFAQLMEMVKGWFTSSGVVSMPTYVVTKISPGVYDIAVALPAVGTQHYEIVFDADKDTFTLSGKVAIIGEDSVFPISAFSAIINASFQGWIEDSVVRNKLQNHRAKMVDRYNTSKPD